MAQAFFSKVDTSVQIVMRAEGDGVVGDMSRSLAPGEDWHGLSYETLFAAGGGTIEFADDGSATILPAKETT